MKTITVIGMCIVGAVLLVFVAVASTINAVMRPPQPKREIDPIGDDPGVDVDEVRP